MAPNAEKCTFVMNLTQGPKNTPSQAYIGVILSS